MKRHAWLIPYSHDHQHGLAQALRLRKAADGDDPIALATRVGEALVFADGALADHMASEEAELLPLARQLGVLEDIDAARIAAEHLQLRVLRNRMQVAPGDPATAREFGEALHDHIRWEERELFERWQQVLVQRGEAVEAAVRPTEPEPGYAQAAPQQAPGANGLALGRLNATNVMLAPGGRIEPATIDRDIAYVVVDGGGSLVVDDGGNGGRIEHALVGGAVIALRQGARRELAAGPAGLRFTTVHLRRNRLDVGKLDR
ncbi:MAG: hemerythrin domain-containing protein [Thermoleophilia bacterium]|nr:hemerythrin domain-containing protein [Thermoleophilia bacterium]